MKNRFAAMLLGVSPLVFASPVYAQAKPQDPPAQAAQDEEQNDNSKEDIVVTGTFIRGIAPTGNQVLGVTQEDIKATGGQSTNDVLATIPQLSNMFNNLNVVGQGGTGPSSINQNAAAQVQRPNLRDIGGIAGVSAGSSPTLILMDGHRMVGAGVDQSSPDAGVIPPGVLERVEIITDGGSAIYGTDAVGGVINFITRRKFDGVRVSGRYGAGNSVSNYNGDLTIGKDWGSGSIFGAVSYSKDNPVFGIDRDWFNAVNWNPDAPFGRHLTGELRNCTAPNVTAGGLNYAVTSPTTIGAANSYNACDVSDYQTITANQKSLSFFAGLTQEIVPGVELSIRGFHTHRNTLTGRGPLTASARTEDEVFTATTGASPYYVDLPGAGANGAAQNVLFSFAPFNGNHAASNETDLKTWGVTAGLKIDLGASWKLNAIANYGESDTFYRNREVNTARLQYYATGNGTPGTTACVFNTVVGVAGCNINPYNIGASNPAALADITNWQRYGGAHQALTNFRGVFDGPIFSLPGGDVRAAVGIEYIGQKIARRGGNSNFDGEAIFPTLVGDRNTVAFFGEVNVPIFGEDNALPLLQSLVLSASVRHDRYSDFGNTTNPNFGLVWKPADWISFRGNWGTSFVAPSLQDVLNQNYQQVGVSPFLPAWGGLVIPGTHRNIAGGAPNGVTTALSSPGMGTVSITGADPNLRPQTGQSWSLGFDARMPFLPALQLSMTYYNVQYKDTLASFTNFISFGTQANYDFWHPYIFINGTDGTGAGGAFTAADITKFCGPAINSGDCAAAAANPNSVYVLADLRQGNFGAQAAEGLDFSLRYAQDFSWGSVNAGVAGNYRLSSKTRAPGATAWTVNDLNQASRYNVSVTTGVTVGKFYARATMRYSDGYDVVFNTGLPVTPTSSGPFQDHVDAYYPVDLFLRYDLGKIGFAKNFQLTLNIANIADDNPPVLRQTGTFGTANGQSLGRVFTFGFTTDF